MSTTALPDLNALAQHLRDQLQLKKFVVLYAYNGTGKTRLSTAFKDLGKDENDDDKRDTLYFNAFTEDLFSWDNDLDNDQQRVLKINRGSRFFDGLEEMEMDNRIRALLDRYADFDFRIDTERWEVIFSREIPNPEYDETDENSTRTITETHIKVSRGEENIFIWCFFLAVVQLALDGVEAYQWVKYIYVDDPISSLDEHNAIAVANHMTQMLKEATNSTRIVISSHHTLFFNVTCNTLRKSESHKHFLKKNANAFILEDTTATPFLHHLSSLVEMDIAQRTGALYTHHFNMLRRIMEQTANFFGMNTWSDCIQPDEDDPDKALYKRVIDLMSHGDYSLYEPREMMEENKMHFRRVFDQFILKFPFNAELFVQQPTESVSS